LSATHTNHNHIDEADDGGVRLGKRPRADDSGEMLRKDTMSSYDEDSSHYDEEERRMKR